LQHAAQPLANRGFTCQLRQATTGRVPLPTTAAPTRARQAVGVDDHVTDLAGEPVGAANEVATRNDASTDARAKGDHHDVGEPSGHADLPLRGSRTCRVVADLDLEAESFGQHSADLEIGDVDQVR
jgi:hypothetical protein